MLSGKQKEISPKSGHGSITDSVSRMRGKSVAATVKAKNSTRNLDSPLFLSRYEFKYRISQAKAAAVEQYVKSYLHLDHYSQNQPGGVYPIVSLYLDTDDLKLCQETLRGKKNRFKLRVRSYSDEPGTPYFFEIKRRLNDIIMKGRARVTKEIVQSMLSGKSVPPERYKSDEQLLKQFQLYMYSLNAKPVVKVRYIRRAYEDNSENRVRITFDRKLCYNPSNDPEVSLNGSGWKRIELGYVILEIKFTARYPGWLSRMVRSYNLQRRSMSKYTASMRQSYYKGSGGVQVLLENDG